MEAYMWHVQAACSIVLLSFAGLMAQSDPVAHANQSNVLHGTQQSHEATDLLLGPEALVPPVRFAKAVLYNSGGDESLSVAIGDVNHDGHPDIVVANLDQNGSSPTGEVSVLLGNGDGTFQAPLSYSSGGFGSQSVAIGDVNGDGNLDLVVGSVCQDKGCSNGYGAVSVLLGNGDGTFQAPVSYSSGGYDGTSVAIADVNGDGRLDVIVANFCHDINCYGYSPGGVSVLLGNGDGTFQAPVIYSSGG